MPIIIHTIEAAYRVTTQLQAYGLKFLYDIVNIAIDNLFSFMYKQLS